MFKKESAKNYWAIVKKTSKYKRYFSTLSIKKSAKNKSQAFNREGNHTLRSELSYELIHSLNNYHLLKLV